MEGNLLLSNVNLRAKQALSFETNNMEYFFCMEFVSSGRERETIKQLEEKKYVLDGRRERN